MNEFKPSDPLVKEEEDIIDASTEDNIEMLNIKDE